MNSQTSFVVVMVIMSCSAHMGMQDNTQFYCGRTLARAIAAICSEGSLAKKSDGTMYNAILSPYYKSQEEQYTWPWLSPSKALGMSLPPKGKRQVVSECCEKACSIDELYSYC